MESAILLPLPHGLNDPTALEIRTDTFNMIGSSLYALMILGDKPTTSRWQREKAVRVRGRVRVGSSAW